MPMTVLLRSNTLLSLSLQAYRMVPQHFNHRPNTTTLIKSKNKIQTIGHSLNLTKYC